MPDLQEDIRQLATFSDNLNQAAPDLLDALDNLTVTSRTIVEKREGLRNLYRSITGASDDLRAFLDANGENIIGLSAASRPTLETLAAADLLRRHLPGLAVRVVNVVDLMRLQTDDEHPHGLTHREFDSIFTTDRPVVFAYHGYPWLIHRLTYRRTNHVNLHVRGYKEEGTTTTPFDMVMMNDLDRFHLVIDVIDRVPSLGHRAAALRQEMVDRRLACRAWTRATGEDHPDVAEWRWSPAHPEQA